MWGGWGGSYPSVVVSLDTKHRVQSPLARRLSVISMDRPEMGSRPMNSFFTRTKIRATIWSSNPTPGHISGQNYNLKRYTHTHIGSQQHCSQWKHLSIDKWMDKEYVVCLEWNGILFSHKKEWNNAIFSNWDGPRDYHTKWNKSDKDKHHMTSLIYAI